MNYKNHIAFLLMFLAIFSELSLFATEKADYIVVGVDSFGKVYGVENLFVADDSIVPIGMDGTPMATAYLIAANIARLLL